MRKFFVLRILVFITLFQILNLTFPLITGMLIDELVEKDWTTYIYVLIGMLLIPLNQGWIEWRRTRNITIWVETRAANLRSKLMNKLFDTSIHYFSYSKTGEIITRSTDDAKKVIQYDKLKFEIFENAFMFLFITISLGMKNIKLLLIVLLCALLYALQAKIIAPWITKLGKTRMKIKDSYNEFIRERIHILTLTRVTGKADWESRKLDEILNDEVQATLSSARITFINDVVSSCIRSLMTGLLYFYAGWLLINKQIRLGDLIVATAFYFPLSNILNNVLHWVNSIKEFEISKSRINEIEQLAKDEYQEGNEKSIPEINKIEFKNVSFQYNNSAKILNDVNFSVSKGEIVALVGASGAGKSTISEILLKFHEPSQGDIIINESLALKDIDGGRWRESIGYAAQNPFFFSDSIITNLMYGNKGISNHTIVDLTKELDLYQIILNKEQGFDTKIENEGSGFSGGQKQRLSLIRAISDPANQILILDEPTSALDYITENKAMKKIYQLREEKITLIIAHRLSTIIHSDCIIVLKDGVIVEKGNHEELIDKKGYYYNLYEHELEQLKDTLTG